MVRVAKGSLWALMLFFLWQCRSIYAKPTIEAVEVAYFFQFTKYIEFKPSRKKYRIAVYGSEKTSELIKARVSQGGSKYSHFQVVDFSLADEVEYLILGGDVEASELRAKVENCKCVTIGLTSFDGQSQIRLIRKADNIRFEIDKKSTDNMGVQVSSKLLRLAEKVRK